MKLQSLIMSVALATTVAASALALEIDMQTVNGRVVDQDGKPLSGVVVTLTSTGDKRIKPWTFTTEKKGLFSNDRVLPGPYEISFEKEGFGKQTGKITVTKEQPYPLGDIKMMPPPPDPTLVYKKVDALLADGKYDEAEAIYKDLIATATANKLPPVDMAKLEFDLGIVYEKKKDWAAAEAAYKKSLELDPTLFAAYGGLGNIYQAQNRPDDAIKLFQSASAAQPDNGRLAYDLGLFLWSKGMNAEAYDALQRAATLLPNEPEIYYHLGVTAIGLNKSDEAIKHLEKYLASNPTNKENVDSAKVLIPAIKQTAASAGK